MRNVSGTAPDVHGVYGTGGGTAQTVCGRDAGGIPSTRREPVPHLKRGGPGLASDSPRVSCPECLEAMA